MIYFLLHLACLGYQARAPLFRPVTKNSVPPSEPTGQPASRLAGRLAGWPAPAEKNNRRRIFSAHQWSEYAFQSTAKLAGFVCNATTSQAVAAARWIGSWPLANPGVRGQSFLSTPGPWCTVWLYHVCVLPNSLFLGFQSSRANLPTY